MKAHLLIALLILSCLACNRENQFHSPLSEVIVASDLEGKSLTGNYNINGVWRPNENYRGYYKQNDSSFYSFLATPYGEHILGIDFVPLEFVGFTKVGKGATISMDYVIFADGGNFDIIEDYYFSDSSKSWLNVLSYDPIERIVEAEAEGDLYVQLPKMNPNNPDTVRIRHAHWRVKLKKP